jgi:hypothetical protein
MAEHVRASDEVMGVLARDFDVRVLNCSPSGCLLETKTPMEVGTVGSLTLVVNGHELLDHVVVVRCQPIQGAGSVYHVGAQFLWLGSLTRHTLRGALGRPGERAVNIDRMALTNVV